MKEDRSVSRVEMAVKGSTAPARVEISGMRKKSTNKNGMNEMEMREVNEAEEESDKIKKEFFPCGDPCPLLCSVSRTRYVSPACPIAFLVAWSR
jgi:hypothetical protein